MRVDEVIRQLQEKSLMKKLLLFSMMTEQNIIELNIAHSYTLDQHLFKDEAGNEQVKSVAMIPVIRPGRQNKKDDARSLIGHCP